MIFDDVLLYDFNVCKFCLTVTHQLKQFNYSANQLLLRCNANHFRTHSLVTGNTYEHSKTRNKETATAFLSGSYSNRNRNLSSYSWKKSEAMLITEHNRLEEHLCNSSFLCNVTRLGCQEKNDSLPPVLPTNVSSLDIDIFVFFQSSAPIFEHRLISMYTNITI